MQQIKDDLKDNFIPIYNVNSRILNGREGYIGRFIVVKGFNDSSFIVHDPGQEHGMADRQIDFETFERAWAFPNERAKNIIAFRLNDQQSNF